MGLEIDTCALDANQTRARSIPTKFTVTANGILVLDFDLGEGCPRFRYEFAGVKGDIYGMDGAGTWQSRQLKVEIKD